MSSTPRSATRLDEDAILLETWGRSPGFIGWIRAVNHKDIGRRFIFTALTFLLLGGVQALLIRIQLGAPENTFLDAETYNQIFTMHGTTMMFLFAVPVVEGIAMYFVPLMIGTRDLPFPRLNAFGYWCYLFGGLLVYTSFLTGQVPDGGWFAYVPLTGPEFSPDRNMDFWLLGISLAEIAAIVGAVELVYVILRQRAPGMSLDKVPVFVWAILVTAFMILFAFPALLAGSTLLEIERQFGTRLFDPGGGGDPLLWQHLFWIFGHPEVYIIFLPAAGIASMVIPVFAGRRLAGYSFVVAALVATGVLSFGLWVHHMFTTGLPTAALSVFAAASIVIAVPSGVQVFAWIATIWGSRPRLRTPMLFMLGFLVLFVLGGITGIMVASVPFDQQVHDSFFVVAHFHYVLIGGMVFPLLGGLHYWWPKLTGGLPGEGLGQTAFWTMFVGFNLTFFPQHWLGLVGMPRRVYTYEAATGWGGLNLLSTIGAFVLAAGILVFAWNLLRSLPRRGTTPPDPWEGDSLEWAVSSPPPAYNFAMLPAIAARHPLWDQADLEAPDAETRTALRELAAPDAPVREVVETTTVGARPRAVALLPGQSWWPLATVAVIVAALVGALLYAEWLFILAGVAVVMLLAGWGADAARPLADAGERSLPLTRSGPTGLLIGAGAIAVFLASLLFAYFDTVARADAFPEPGGPEPHIATVAVAVVLAAIAWAAARWGRRDPDDRRRVGFALGASLLTAIGLGLLAAAALVGSAGVATESAYGSAVAVLLGAVALAALAAAVGAAVAMWAARRPGPAGVASPLPIVSGLTGGVLAVVVLVMAVLWLTPRVL